MRRIFPERRRCSVNGQHMHLGSQEILVGQSVSVDTGEKFTGSLQRKPQRARLVMTRHSHPLYHTQQYPHTSVSATLTSHYIRNFSGHLRLTQQISRT
jgi:hypothetical protein